MLGSIISLLSYLHQSPRVKWPEVTHANSFLWPFWLSEGVGAAMWMKLLTLQTFAADVTEEEHVDSQQSQTAQDGREQKRVTPASLQLEPPTVTPLPRLPSANMLETDDSHRGENEPGVCKFCNYGSSGKASAEAVDHMKAAPPPGHR